jgi:hypothetical protein
MGSSPPMLVAGGGTVLSPLLEGLKRAIAWCATGLPAVQAASLQFQNATFGSAAFHTASDSAAGILITHGRPGFSPRQSGSSGLPKGARSHPPCDRPKIRYNAV